MSLRELHPEPSLNDRQDVDSSLHEPVRVNHLALLANPDNFESFSSKDCAHLSSRPDPEPGALPLQGAKDSRATPSSSPLWAHGSHRTLSALKGVREVRTVRIRRVYAPAAVPRSGSLSPRIPPPISAVPVDSTERPTPAVQSRSRAIVLDPSRVDGPGPSSYA